MLMLRNCNGVDNQVLHVANYQPVQIQEIEDFRWAYCTQFAFAGPIVGTSRPDARIKISDQIEPAGFDG
jgi:hypothetical protein